MDRAHPGAVGGAEGHLGGPRVAHPNSVVRRPRASSWGRKACCGRTDRSRPPQSPAARDCGGQSRTVPGASAVASDSPRKPLFSPKAVKLADRVLVGPACLLRLVPALLPFLHNKRMLGDASVHGVSGMSKVCFPPVTSKVRPLSGEAYLAGGGTPIFAVPGPPGSSGTPFGGEVGGASPGIEQASSNACRPLRSQRERNGERAHPASAQPTARSRFAQTSGREAYVTRARSSSTRPASWRWRGRARPGRRRQRGRSPGHSVP